MATANPNDDQHRYLLSSLAPALSNDPAQRPRSAEAFRSSIHTALSTTGGSSRAGDAGQPSAPRYSASERSLDAPNPTVVQPPNPPAAQQPQVTAPAVRKPLLRRTARWVGIAIGAIVLVGGVALLVSQQLRETDVVVIGENLGRSSASTPQGLVEIEGPRRIPIGETGVFVVSSPEASAHVWTLADGTQIDGTVAIRVTGRAPGDSELSVKATTEDGSEIDVEFPFSVGPLE